MFFTGLIASAMGLVILGYFGFNKISREIYKYKLMKTSIIFEIPDLNIKVPVLEGTDNETLKYAAGHFENTGSLGKGNYCIAGHSSTIYACVFNDLKNAEPGMRMKLYDKNDVCFNYIVTEIFTVEPEETWILSDFGDSRITVISCTEDGSQRQVVIGEMQTDNLSY